MQNFGRENFDDSTSIRQIHQTFHFQSFVPYGTNYVQGIGNRILCMDIPCPINVSNYLSIVTASFFISTLSFKYLFLHCTDGQIFPYGINVQQYRPQAKNVHTKLHILANSQKL